MNTDDQAVVGCELQRTQQLYGRHLQVDCVGEGVFSMGGWVPMPLSSQILLTDSIAR
jgi:hypothetical protein